MSNDSFECLWTLGTIEHQQSVNVMERKSSFWESAKIFKDELKYLGYHKTFIFKTGNKNVLWFQYPGATVRNYKILGIPESLHRGVPLPPPYVQGRIDSWKCCFFLGEEKTGASVENYSEHGRELTQEYQHKMTNGVDAGIWTRATVGGDNCSQNYATLWLS